MQTSEEKICTFTQKGTRLQLVKVNYEDIGSDGIPTNLGYSRFQVRLNRKIISSSISEYNERKIFATYCQNIVLQLKIY